MPSSTSSSRWAGWFLALYGAAAACALGLIAALNFYADPYGLYGGGADRPLVAYHLRLWKAGQHGPADTAILGSSRALDGLRPSDFPPAAGRVFNYAVGGGTLWESAAWLKHAYYTRHVKAALLTVDLFGMNAGKPYHDDVTLDRLNLSHAPLLPLYWKDAIETSLSWSALRDSLSTLRGRASAEETIAPDGFGAIPGWDSIVAAHGYEEEFRKAEDGYIQTTWWDGQGGFAFERGAVSAFAAFRDAIRFARAHDIALNVAFSPVHARLLLAMDQAGLWDELETAKRTLTAIAEEETGGKAAVWDFADFSPEERESVPVAAGARMKYYREASHYTPVLGRMMIGRIYEGAGGDFGARLSPGTMEAHLEEVRRRKAAYAAAHPDAAGDIAKRVRALCPCNGKDGNR